MLIVCLYLLSLQIVKPRKSNIVRHLLTTNSVKEQI